MADTVKVTDTGLGIITKRLKDGDTGATAPKYVHWGTGVTAAVEGDTAMQTPGAESRVSGTDTQTNTGGTTNDTYQVVGTLTCNATAKAITECGLFDALTSGNLFLRATFSPINVSENDSIQFTIRATFNQA